MKLTVTLTDELTAAGRAIREEVFVREQGYTEEFDEIDGRARHAVVCADGVPAAAGRGFFDGETYVLGRLAVRLPYRGKGLGRALVEGLEQDAAARGATVVRLTAQLHALPFYAKLGYAETGERAFDEGHPHAVCMKRLSRT